MKNITLNQNYVKRTLKLCYRPMLIYEITEDCNYSLTWSEKQPLNESGLLKKVFPRQNDSGNER